MRADSRWNATSRSCLISIAAAMPKLDVPTLDAMADALLRPAKVGSPNESTDNRSSRLKS